MGSMRVSATAIALVLSCAPFAPAAFADEQRDEVIVTASPITNSDAAPARPAERIERDEIWRKGGTSLGDFLADVPGITQSSFAVGASRPIIRGLDNFRVRVQEHGIGSHDVSALSEDHGVPIDPLSATAVEIIRGPSTLRYGSGAIGGVITSLNNRIARTPVEGLDAEAYGSYSTVDNAWEGGAMADMGGDNIALHVDGFIRDTENYDIPIKGGTQEFTSSQSWGAAGGASYVDDWGFFGLSVAHFDSEYDIPAPEDPAEPLSIDLKQTRFRLGGEIEKPWTGFEAVRLDGGYSDYEHDEIEGGEDIASTFTVQEFEGRLEFEHSYIGNVHGAFGVQLGHRDIEAAGEGGELLAPADTFNIAAFVFEEIDFSDRTVLEIAGRVEYVSHEGTAIDGVGTEFLTDPDFVPWGISAALVHDLDDGWSVALTGQIVERAPDVLELFAKGPHHATETFEVGDSDLETEQARSIEFRVKREGEGLRVDGSVFYTDYDGFINRTLTGVDCNEDFASCGAPDPMEEILDQLVYTQEDARFFGAEFLANAPLAKIGSAEIRGEARVDFVRAKIKDGGGNLPRIPPLRFGGALEVFTAQGTYGRISLLRATRQDRIAANESETAGYNLLDLELAQRIPVQGTTFDVALVASNLLDDAVRNHSSLKKEEVVLPGRSFRFVVRTSF